MNTLTSFRASGAWGRRRSRPGVEALEGRALLSLTYSHVQVPDLSDEVPPPLTVGGDGNLWFVSRPHVPPYPLTLPGPFVVGTVTPSGESTRYALPHDGTYPEAITTGPDGNVWFTEGNNALPSNDSGTRKIARVTPSGVITAFPLPHGAYPIAGQLTSGPGGALWAVADNGIDRVSTSGAVTNFPLYSLPSQNYIEGITAGPDGNLWFAGNLGNGPVIGRMTPTGAVDEFPLPSSAPFPVDLIAGPDGNVWFLDAVGYSDYEVGKVSPSGVVTLYALPAHTIVGGIAADPVNNDIWFTAVANNGGATVNLAVSGLGRVTPGGVVTVVPGFPQADAAALGSIAFGPGGFLWYAGGNEVGKAVFAPLTVTDVRRLDPTGVKGTRIVLTFSQPLDPATAQDLGNFAIRAFRKGRKGIVAGKAVRIDAATYDPAAQTVTLSVHPRLRPGAHFTISAVGTPHAGLADQDGEPLSGAGARGGSFLAVVPPPTRSKPRK